MACKSGSPVASGSWVKKSRTLPWTRTLGSEPGRTLPWTRTPGSEPGRTLPWTRALGSKPGRAPRWTRAPGSKPGRAPRWTRAPGSKAKIGLGLLGAEIGLWLGLGPCVLPCRTPSTLRTSGFYGVPCWSAESACCSKALVPIPNVHGMSALIPVQRQSVNSSRPEPLPMMRPVRAPDRDRGP
jgi:hypothetical protein